MTDKEFDDFLDKHPTVEYTFSDTDDFIFFRDPDIAWYRNENHMTQISNIKFIEMTPADLEEAIYAGLLVDHITRVTGYFTKVSQWNKGKLGELKDRRRTGLESTEPD